MLLYAKTRNLNFEGGPSGSQHLQQTSFVNLEVSSYYLNQSKLSIMTKGPTQDGAHSVNSAYHQHAPSDEYVTLEPPSIYL